MATDDDPSRGEERELARWQTSPGWWFRRVGLPLIALTVIVGAIVWSERPQSSNPRVATADEPLDQDTGAPQEGKPAPDFTLTGINGSPIRLSDYEGKVVLLNFWATWCGPCREEMPLFDEALTEFGAERLVVLAVNVQERSVLVRPFVERLALTYPIALDEDGAVSRRYRVRSFPTTYFIGRDGRVEGRRVGQYTRQILFARLDQLLGEP